MIMTCLLPDNLIFLLDFFIHPSEFPYLSDLSLRHYPNHVHTYLLLWRSPFFGAKKKKREGPRLALNPLGCPPPQAAISTVHIPPLHAHPCEPFGLSINRQPLTQHLRARPCIFPHSASHGPISAVKQAPNAVPVIQSQGPPVTFAPYIPTFG